MDAETVREFFSAFGPIDLRRMFGGFGIYVDGMMFGVVAFDAIHLRADEATIPDFTAEDCRPFSYTTRRGTVESRKLWKIPERLYDDPDELAIWARKARAAAQRLKLAERRPAATTGRATTAGKKKSSGRSKAAATTHKARSPAKPKKR
jgi:DNA transformation protein